MSAPPPSLLVSQGGPSATTATSTATVSSSVVTSNPLSVKVTLLRKPELYNGGRMETPELCEEGDILYDVLGGKSAVSKYRHCPPCVISPVLTFSTSKGIHLVGESFKALMSFRNNLPSTAPNGGALTKLFFRVELVNPQAQRTVLWDREINRLEPKSNRELRVEYRFMEAGKHTLSVTGSFCDTLNESRRFSWASSLEVSRGIIDVSRNVTLLPPATSQRAAAASSAGDVVSPLTAIVPSQQQQQQRLCVSVTLQNVLPDTSLVLTDVRLTLKDPSLFRITANSAAALASPSAATQHFSLRCSGGGRDALEDAHMAPRDTRTFMFEITHTASEVSSASGNTATTRSATASSSVGGPAVFFSTGSGAVGAQKTFEIGYVEWEWRRANGDGGCDMSQMIRVTRPTGMATSRDIDMACVSVVKHRDGEEGLATGASGALIAGSVCDVCLVATNRSAQRKDLLLAIHPQHLLPMFAYTGPTMRPLGFIEANSELHFSLAVVPLMSGVLTLTGAAVELRDARTTSTIYWPTKPPTVTAPPPLSHSAAGGASTSSSASFTSTGAAPSATITLPPEPWPPKICDALVF